MRLFRIALVLLSFSICFPLQAAITSQIDRNSLEQGESFLLVLNITGNDGGEVDLSPLDNDFEVLRRSHQSTTSIVNGEMHSTTKLLISLAPKRAGKLEVPPLTLNGEQSQPHSIEVTPVRMKSAVDGGVELLSSLSDKTPLVQQPVVYQLNLVLGQPIANAVFQEPSIKQGKALIQPLGEQKQYRQQLKGRDILVVEQSWLITPQQSGVLEIEAAKLSAEMTNGSAPYSRYNDPRSMRRIFLSADSYSLDVAPIPQSFRGNSWLPAADLKLSGKLSSDSWKVGDPVTRTISLQASGVSQDQLVKLELPEVEGIKQYSAKPVYQQDQSGTDVSSSMTLEVTIIPGRQGQVTLPEIRIPWWNTTSNTAEEAVLEAQTLSVAAGDIATATAPAALSAPDTQPVAPAPLSNGDTQSAVSPIQPLADTSVPAEKADAGSPAIDMSWWVVAVAVVLGGVAGSALTLAVSRGLGSRAKTGGTVDQQSGEGFSLHDLRRACNNHDPHAARAAMLAWGRHQFPGCSQLNSLLNRVSPELKEAINELNASCYAERQEGWDGSRLFSLVKAYVPQQHARQAAGTLAPLVPGGRSAA